MEVKIKYAAQVREITKRREEFLQVREGITVGEVLERLSKKYGKKFTEFLFENGKLRQDVLVLLDGRHINLLKGLQTELRGEELISIFISPLLGGG